MTSSDDPAVFKPALLVALGRSLALAVMFLVPIAFARILSPSEFGTYKQLFLIHATIYGLGLGLAESLFYFVPLDQEKSGRYVANATVLLGGMGLLGWVALVGAGPAAERWFHNPALPRLTAFLGCHLALTMASAPLEIVMISRSKNSWASLTYVASDLVRGTLMLAPVLIWRRLDVLLIGSIGFALLRLVTLFAYSLREFTSQLRPDITCLKSQLLYSVPLQLAVALQILQLNFHRYVVALHFDSATFARYSVGCMHIPLFDLVAGSVCNIMMVRMSERLKEGQHGTILEIWSDTTQKLALVFIPAVTLLFVVSSDLIDFVFTTTYRSSVSLFRIWLFSFLLSGLLPHGVLRVYGDTRRLAVCNLVKLVVAAVLIYPSIAAFGLAGAVLTSVLAILGGKCILLLRLQRLTGATLSTLLPWRRLGAVTALSIAALAPAWAIGHMTELSVSFRVAATGVAYACTYAIGVFTWIARNQEPDDSVVFSQG